jgi:hypothetical protein
MLPGTLRQERFLERKGAFNSFSSAVQREIQELAKELEGDPEFLKKTGSLRQ